VRTFLRVVVVAAPLFAAACASIVGFPDVPDIADGSEGPDSTRGDGSTEGSADVQGDVEGGAFTDTRVGGEAEAEAEAEAGCPAPMTLECNGVCVDPTLPAHCGGCSACSAPEAGAGEPTCTKGVCTVGCEADSSTPTNCSGACVDLTQPASCGACGNTCAGPASTQGHATCTLDGGGLPVDAGGDGGPCGIACNATYHACGADCLSDTDDPSADPCVVSNATGVFVAPAPKGNDTTGAGTEQAPFATLAMAVTRALTGKKRVYACLGTYSQQLSLTATADGLTVYGGLDCANGWKYVGSGSATPTVIAATSAAPSTSLTVTGPMTIGVAFEDVGFKSGDGMNPGDSSVAVFVTSSAKLKLTRGTVTAGKGVVGTPGGTVTNWSGTAPPGTSPVDNLHGGGPGGVNACGDGSTSTGGTGGFGAAGDNGSSVPSVASPSPNGGTGGVSCTNGTAAVSGAPPGTGGAGATSSGSITSTGWSAGPSGLAGTRGSVAQGGGGGGGVEPLGFEPSPGGGGGAGGCGGGQGLGGSTGGSSIGILVDQATLALTSVTVTASAAGAGGLGGVGQLGQAGGAGATGFGCTGSAGGTGSAGSGGGGGGGGDSVGIAWLGTAGPSVNGTVITADQPSPSLGITAGTAGSAGLPGTGGGVSGGPGVAGSAKAIQQFP
jgi:hypothetical protein